MSEELIKKLEDSGYFNQTQQGVEEVPTLSALIEACGEGLWKIEREVGAWSVYPTMTENRTVAFICSENLEEAVARLWLALND